MRLAADDPLGFLTLVLLGAVASAINSVAGGGSLVSFPTLTFGFGIDPKIANATNSVALWPGSLSGALGFRNLLDKTGHALRAMFLPTLIGSAAGATLLMQTGDELFEQIVPWLILLATLVLAFQKRIRAWVGTEHKKLPFWAGGLIQLGVAFYGGYFGAGMGIMMLAAFALTLEGNVHELNALKNWLALLINFTATILFIYYGLVLWLPAAAMIVGALIGGYAAARVSQRVDPEKMRKLIVAYGLVMTVVFFVEAFRT